MMHESPSITVIASRIAAYVALFVVTIMVGVVMESRHRIANLETALSERVIVLSAINDRMERLDLAVGPQLRERLMAIDARLNAACPPVPK